MSSSGSKDTIILERRFVPEGTLVMRQGEEGYSAYLIQSGSVGIYSEQDGRKVELARLQAGQIFGEMALIFDEPRKVPRGRASRPAAGTASTPAGTI